MMLNFSSNLRLAVLLEMVLMVVMIQCREIPAQPFFQNAKWPKKGKLLTIKVNQNMKYEILSLRGYCLQG